MIILLPELGNSASLSDMDIRKAIKGLTKSLDRIITDGILNIEFTKDGFSLNPMMPKELKHITIKNIFVSGDFYDIQIENIKDKIETMVTKK